MAAPEAAGPAETGTQLTPEGAGAWMGAFLNNTVPDNPVLGDPAIADDNSTEQQEQ
jgi:hypothetical protein